MSAHPSVFDGIERIERSVICLFSTRTRTPGPTRATLRDFEKLAGDAKLENRWSGSPKRPRVVAAQLCRMCPSPVSLRRKSQT
jgi:hypothetical protein